MSAAAAVMDYLRDTHAWVAGHGGPASTKRPDATYWIIENGRGQWWGEKQGNWSAVSHLYDHGGEPTLDGMIEVAVPDWFTGNIA